MEAVEDPPLEVPSAVVAAGRSTEALYRAHIGDAVRLAYLLEHDMATAEDLAHDAFLRAASRVSQLRSPERFGAYLRRAVLHRALNHRRGAARETARGDRAQAGRPVAHRFTEATDEHLDVLAALRRLPDRQRAVVVLRYWLDLSEKDIAEALACRPGTVKSSLARALERLREVMGDEH